MSAVLDRLVQIPAEELAADEADKVQWALAALEEVKTHPRANQYALELAQQAKERGEASCLCASCADLKGQLAASRSPAEAAISRAKQAEAELKSEQRKVSRLEEEVEMWQERAHKERSRRRDLEEWKMGHKALVKIQA
ncbi:unnamed protein product [Cladocopium goreaui]|uniref:Uncharacterized protein n=1 Tax=Cladocopium goreaui TaxID=2562237 RepID=A0A9P1BIM9_9DINO|nr:unnamed protein product [Cladocopium goreaui]